jgi:hypothetical protein
MEFTIVGEELWDRMERAVEKVNERLRKTVRILEDAKVPYAVIGGHAVHVLFVGKVERKGEKPNPDIEPWVRSSELRAISLEALVRMKRNAFRDKIAFT